MYHFSFFRSAIFVLFFCTLFSCHKNSDSTGTFTPIFYIYNGGTTAFDNNLLLFPSSDTLEANIIIRTTFAVNKDIAVTLEVADTARESYNTTYGTDYLSMPASAYKLSSTSGVIPAGMLADTIPIEFYRSAFTPDENFMLPILLKNAAGEDISTTVSIIYFHRIGNSLSGVYSDAGARKLYEGDAADSIFTDSLSVPATKSVVPQDSYISHLDYADLGGNGWQYNLFTDPDTQKFSASPNDIMLLSIEPGSFELLDAEYDSLQQRIYLKSSYKNSSGDERIVEETLTAQ